MSPDDAGKAKQDKRRERLAASLRENLKRRKTQQRSRAADERLTGDASRRSPSAGLKDDASVQSIIGGSGSEG